MIRYCKVCDEPMGAEPGLVHMECQEDDELDDDEPYIVCIDDDDEDDDDEDDRTDLWDGGGE